MDTVERFETESPLYPIRRWIKFFQILGGFPLKMEAKASVFSRSPSYTTWTFIQGIFVIGIYVFYLAEDEDDIKNAIENHYTATEVSTEFVTEYSQIAMFFLFVFLCAQMGPKLTEICKQIMALTDIPIDQNRLKTLTLRNKIQWSIMVLNLIFACVTSAVSVFYVDDITIGKSF